MRDVLGAWLSVLCMLHCFLPILLVSFGASLGLNHAADVMHGEWVHVALLFPIIAILAISLPKAYLSHGDLKPTAMALFGILVLIVAISIGGTTETILTIMGSMFIIAAHMSNRKTLKSFKLAKAVQA